MANPPPVVIVEKKRGMGCCGIGCVILLIVALLLAVIIGVGCYFTYSKINGLTSAQPLAIQSFDGGDDLYHTATQKLTDFDQAVQQHKAATLHLNADEINTLIARDPDFKNNKVQVFVTITGDVAELKASVPLSLLPSTTTFKDRYLDCNITFGFDFDPQSKALNLLVKKMRIGSENVPNEYLTIVQSEFDPTFNQMLQNDATCKAILDQAKTVEIKNGELVIETE